MDELQQRDLDVLWHPCSQMKDYQSFPPIEVRSAHGSHIELANGRKVIDAISSWWCKSLGHGHEHLCQALITQSKSFDQIILANTTNQPIVRLSERLLNMANGHAEETWDSNSSGVLPGFYGKCFYADNGSTAVEICMKMAMHAQARRGAAQRTKFVALKHGYHGETIATLSAGDCGLYGDPYRALMFDVPMIDGLPYRSGPSDPKWMDASAEWPAIEKQLNKHVKQLAAVMYEPVLQGAGGMLIYSPDLLRRLRAWADAHDVYLIADEIAAGMGRCGAMLASHLAHSADTPALADFVALSKGLTGGMLPLSAVLTTNAVYDLFIDDYTNLNAFMHSNTYTGNALGVAVANAALDVYAGSKICRYVNRMNTLLYAALEGLMDQRTDVVNLRSVGLVAAVDVIGKDGKPFDWKSRTGFQIFQQAVELGAWLRPLGDTIYIFPPLNIDEHDMLTIVDILRKSLKVVIDKNRDTINI